MGVIGVLLSYVNVYININLLFIFEKNINMIDYYKLYYKL